MKKDLTRNSALTTLGAMLEIPRDVLREELSSSDVPNWDSMGHINILAFLDKEYQIQLSNSEMATITTLRSVLDLIELKGGFNVE